jgi:hypothetical protein
MATQIPDQLEQFQIAQAAARQMFETLGNDCKDHLEALQESGSQLHRRSYIRAVFAFIEGLLYCQKMSTLNLGLLFGAVTLHELVALENLTLEIDNKGDVKPRATFPNFLNNLKFVFKVYSKSIGSDFQLSLGGIGWESLQQAVKIRDRLMHPKDPKELIITEKEVMITQNAFTWFFLSYSLCSLFAQKAVCLRSGDKSDLEWIEEQIAQVTAKLK